jgi:endonuclease/exonuclease/phosphatase family metal-dependent hydrolase
MFAGQPELHCDFVFVSEELTARVRSLVVDQETQASDHQPLVLEIG